MLNTFTLFSLSRETTFIATALTLSYRQYSSGLFEIKANVQHQYLKLMVIIIWTIVNFEVRLKTETQQEANIFLSNTGYTF